VFHRLGGDTSEESEDFRVIEKDEIDQFERELKGLRTLESDTEVRKRFMLKRWQRPPWLRELTK
jgi:hypothetical protein